MTLSPDFTDLAARLGRMTHTLQYSAGLNPVQWEVLRYLSRANRYSCVPTALANYLGITKGTVSQTLIALEQKGLISRSRNEQDKRSIRIALTKGGEKFIKKDPLFQMQQAGAALSSSACDSAAETIDRLLGSMNLALGRSAFGVCGDCLHLDPPCGKNGNESCVQCGLTGENLNDGELAQICVDFQPTR